LRESQKEGDHQEDQDVGGNKIKLGLGSVGRVGMDWNDLAQEENQWRALVNVVMKFRFL
jgi:hypothetical protein